MRGTQKQIEWALKIKAEKMAELHKEPILSAATPLAAFYRDVIAQIEANEKAGYWIEGRNLPAFTMVQELVKSDGELMARYRTAKGAL